MKSLSNVIFLSLILFASCGIETAPLDSDTNGNTVVQDTLSGGFTTVTRTVQTVGSYYYSFQGELHTSCANEGTQPYCVYKQVEKDCNPTISQCYYNPGGTYTTTEAVNYVNECSWQQAGSPTPTYTSRPCTY